MFIYCFSRHGPNNEFLNVNKYPIQGFHHLETAIWVSKKRKRKKSSKSTIGSLKNIWENEENQWMLFFLFAASGCFALYLLFLLGCVKISKMSPRGGARSSFGTAKRKTHARQKRRKTPSLLAQAHKRKGDFFVKELRIKRRPFSFYEGLRIIYHRWRYPGTSCKERMKREHQSINQSISSNNQSNSKLIKESYN